MDTCKFVQIVFPLDQKTNELDVNRPGQCDAMTNGLAVSGAYLETTSRIYIIDNRSVVHTMENPATNMVFEQQPLADFLGCYVTVKSSYPLSGKFLGLNPNNF